MSEPAPPDQDRAVDDDPSDQGREFIERRHRFPANGPGFLLAPIVWFGYFIAVYALQGAGCASGLHHHVLIGANALQLLLGLLTLSAAAIIVVLGVWSYRAWRRLLDELDEEERQRHGHSTFLAYGALLHAGLFLVATLWSGVPILLLDLCASP
jgi:hypothetical protein